MKCSKSLRFLHGAPPQTPLGELTTLPRPPSREGLLAFSNHNFAPSARSHIYIYENVRVGRTEILLQLLDLNFFPSRLPLLNSVELTNYGYFCILCTHPIYVSDLRLFHESSF